MNYRKINNLVGWLTGGIATIVYLMTMEPTVSFWDCGEFIATAYKLEVGHSPGAPFFMLLGRFFSLFAPAQDKVALLINSLSAIASGMTILFLFWTITHFAKKLVARDTENPEPWQLWSIMGAGMVGGLAYTFSDTFWFSAVEAEVYATSSFFTALVFWAILKWEHVADNKYADRWLVFIAFMMGISVGIHLLNLLAIPAVAMVYYFKRYKVTTGGTIIAFFVGCILLALVQFGVLQGLPMLASKLELLFVNDFGLPFDSGALFFVLLLVALFAWVLIFAKRRGMYLLHTGMLCLLFVVIGFSSYMAAMIRSRADVPIDMTNPDNVMSLVSYIQREQFGQQPLLTGPYFTDLPIKLEETGENYIRGQVDGKDKYIEVGKKTEPAYEPGSQHFFPRIWDYNNPSHVSFYRSYLGLGPNEEPTARDNYSFFFNYQLNWMWWRYFMWNYAGRQNDYQGQGNPRDGNWITGIKFLDKGRVGDMDKMASGYRDNRARNELYALPLILGILGLIFQFNRHKRDGLVVFLLFFFTGIAIVLYLNNTPLQPRERDYAYAGSTYAFAIWIGLGVLMIHNWLRKAVKGVPAAALATGLCLLVPVLMAAEEWDDHDRSEKTLAWDTAWNTLQSCDSNAILFTYGDNDTYPLWYLQEVEGIRTDVRIINLSLLGIDWYIDQLTYKVNKADAVPMVWDREDYMGDQRQFMRYLSNPQIPQDRYFDLKEICEFITNPNAQVPLQTGEKMNYLPTKNFSVAAPDMATIRQMGWVTDTTGVIPGMMFTYAKDVAYKDDLAVLNIVAGIASEGWKRPIYFGGGLPSDNYQGMQDYLRMEGVVYRLLPFRMTPENYSGQDVGTVNIDKSYKLFAETYTWGGAGGDNIYYDEKNRIMFFAYRINSARVANELARTNRKQQAIQVLDRVMENISPASYPYDAPTYLMAQAYYNAGANDKGAKLARALARNAQDDINWIMTLDDDERATMSSEAQRDLSLINILSTVARQAGDEATATELEQTLNGLLQRVQGKINLNM